MGTISIGLADKDYIPSHGDRNTKHLEPAQCTNCVLLKMDLSRYLAGLESPSVAAATATTPVTTATATATVVAAPTAAVAAAAAAAAVVAAAAAAAIALTATATTATATAFTGCGLVDTDHAAHPLHILEVIDGFLLYGIIAELDKCKTALATCLAIKGKAALANFAILPE